MAVGTTVDFAYEGNPTKARGEKALVPRLAQAMEGWRKGGPPTKKKCPVVMYVPEFLEELGMAKDANEIVKAVGDLAVIAFYYSLRFGGYTVKNKETRQSKWCSSSCKIQCFFVRMLKGICSNFQ